MNLKKYRVKVNNLTQQKLADALGVSRSTVAMWENGKNEPDNDMLGKIAEYFHITTDELLGRTHEEKVEKPPISALDQKKQLVSSKMDNLNESQISRIIAYIDGMTDEAKDS